MSSFKSKCIVACVSYRKGNHRNCIKKAAEDFFQASSGVPSSTFLGCTSKIQSNCFDMLIKYSESLKKGIFLEINGNPEKRLQMQTRKIPRISKHFLYSTEIVCLPSKGTRVLRVC
ncbi:hypothetical protein CEXT_111271 [Caerostris extrusa]|uniref:Uncharacterized protein n=1 Tax=Caerostris extrusa TaxID=172846 RepID=A0AAV4SCJ1_CAEEX|nr:hypothetical protein CEXT_111271 [Caerostris extrusa]